mmetsp:Transcript_44364/g.112261  ORF Transcript_44364/g.112261 Transcript_44364/m.112261 type:complete len:201 (-) Transcript_44364:52-654(-)
MLTMAAGVSAAKTSRYWSLCQGTRRHCSRSGSHRRCVGCTTAQSRELPSSFLARLAFVTSSLYQCFLPCPRQAVSGASRSQSGNTRRRMSATSALARATAWDPLSPRATPRVDTPRISRVDMRRRWVFPLLRLDTPRGVRLEPEPPARALSDAAPPSPSPRRSSDVAFRASTSGSDGLGRYTCRFPVGLRWGTATRLRSR